VVIVLVFIVLTGLMVEQAIAQYFAYKTITFVSVLPGDTMLLPDITVCSLQPFKRTGLNHARINPTNDSSYAGALSKAGDLDSVYTRYMYHVMAQKPKRDCADIKPLTAADWRSISDRIRLVIPDLSTRINHCRSRREVISHCEFIGAPCNDSYWTTVPDQRWVKPPATELFFT
jgi:hypothetical protein